ncbi:MAG: YidC/Oxa1 family insertase periplasmic-domain containing protein [Gemmatimonadota bacterium]|jgi:YidC/Oxa1 family membrane protein insertase|nr:MAG: YidC/Oxa1 family insertase periplasmic-domain containing protein [Gemmatimonadota bacterium]
MERRLLLAIGLMLGVILLANLLFPPRNIPPPAGDGDSAILRREPPAPETPDGVPAVRPQSRGLPAADDVVGMAEEEPPADALAELLDDQPADTIEVSSPLYRLKFVTRGAALVSAGLPRYRSYAPEDPDSASAELVRPGDRLLGFRVAAGADTVDLSERLFEPSAREIRLTEGSPLDSLVFRHRIASTERGDVVFRVTYHFDAARYLVRVEGALEGVGDRGYTLATSLGEGLRTNEADAKADYGQLAYVTRGRQGIRSRRLSAVSEGEREAAEGGPFDWVAVKNKYFLVAFLAAEEGPGFGGLLVEGLNEENAARITATLPVPAGSPGFAFGAYLGPQGYGRLKAIGRDLQNVNPVGWRWLQPVIRPLVAIVMAILTWMHETLSLAYGWVLILFGVLMRIVLFPLYQKSMRAQMAQMRVQPLMKDIRERHKDDPQKMQQEMMRLYKEHNINPLAGCLPMMLPFPILITLFFVFQNTIELRGVPFLWLPDLSLKDPLYIVPLLMGGSMFLLQWIGQRGMEQTAQTKMLGYGMPVLFTFLFANFPSGLNLYYATSNIASLPQQFYIARERQKARGGTPSDPQEVVEEPGDGAAEDEAQGPPRAAKGGKRGGSGRKDGGKRRGSSKKRSGRR